MQKTNRDEIFDHIKEECIKDPFYLAKMMLAALGKNIFWTVLRIAGYVLVIYLLSTYTSIDKTAIGVIVLGLMVAYFTLNSMHGKIKSAMEVKKDGH